MARWQGRKLVMRLQLGTVLAHTVRAACTARSMHPEVTEESPLARVRDKHVCGATHGPRLVAQHALERARAAQQRTHARHQLRLCLARSFPGICRAPDACVSRLQPFQQKSGLQS